MQFITALGIKNSDYFSKNRLLSCHHQLRLIFSLGDQVKNVLEIGIFNSPLAGFLRSSGYNVSTADIDPSLNPEIILDLTADFFLPEDEFDVITLFQVLEHLPYEKSEQALKKLGIATKKFLAVSIPCCTQYLAIQVTTSFSGRPRHLLLNVPKFWSKKPVCDQHYWEMGLKDYPKKRILNSIINAGLTVRQEFTDPAHPYHYFLLLEKTLASHDN
ncbi:MAG: methyltransferase type 11 [Cyanobacteriota bacterium]